MQERAELDDLVSTFDQVDGALDDIEVYLELAEMSDDPDEAIEDASSLIDECQFQLHSLRHRRMFQGEHDDRNAILSIQAGAGGTEAQDWTSMLLEMYSSYIDRKGWDADINRRDGQEAGLKAVDVRIEGDYAYGRLKAERGVHRLERISPFDSGGRRHTSFASVDVSPEIDDDIEIDLHDNDLDIGTMKSSGPGGQHANVTESAVRITHEPTGITVQCQSERSQHKNRSMARTMLRSKLYEREMDKRRREAQEAYDDEDDAEFGNQIRSYTLDPYRKIKDHRTDIDINDVESVLHDGHLDSLIEPYLLQSEDHDDRSTG